MNIQAHLQVQNIALKALRDIKPFIRSGATEKAIAEECARLMGLSGISE
jgi:hypothetical protein